MEKNFNIKPDYIFMCMNIKPMYSAVIFIFETSKHVAQGK